ncbi:MAG: class I SAM-dependent methyltransferase [Candidatus Berkiella sp.]
MDFQIDFTSGPLRYRHDHVQGKNELILKAIGLKKDYYPNVLDATAGLGKDAFLIATSGCEVTLCERHQGVSTLLEDALHRAKADSQLLATVSRMHLVKSCAIHYLQQNPELHPDVIYCDPMFPKRQKSALVKKDMQLLQQMVGQDNDAMSLIELCYKIAQKRLVVKRALNAPPFLPNVDITFKARSHRFDVYLR